MRSKTTLFVVALLALAALEFGVLGADAASIGNRSLPPIAVRGLEVPTEALTPLPPPTFSPTPVLPPGANEPASIELAPSPLAIHCDGVERARLTVHVRDASGQPVPDHTDVYFSAYNGSVDPSNMQTIDGVAQTDAVFYSDLFPPGSNLFVSVGEMDAGIRIHCFPNSGCPLSPPPGASPPCPTPTPAPQCDPTSPPTSVSPPCSPPPATPCPLSPPSEWSPPCATPTPPPPTCDSSPPVASVSPPCGGVAAAIDCDTSAPGIQSYCNVPAAGLQADADVVITNNTSAPISIGAFDLRVHDSATSRLVPDAPLDQDLNANPDFNDAGFVGSWHCTPPSPQADDGSDGAGAAVSFISCYSGVAPLTIVQPGDTLSLVRVHYHTNASPPVGFATLSLSDFHFYDGSFSELGSCSPFVYVPIPCDSADVLVGAPPVSPPPSRTPESIGIVLALDCDPSQAGVQDHCAIGEGAAPRDVDVVITNTSQVDRTLGAFDFEVHDSNSTALAPLPGGDSSLAGNPDFNDAIGPQWACIPPPQPDKGTDGAGRAVSFLSCLGIGVPVDFPAGSSLKLATIHYQVTGNGSPASASLTVGNVHSSDKNFADIGDCAPVNVWRADCLAATIDIGAQPSAGTATAPPSGTTTPTPTPTSGPAGPQASPPPDPTATPARTATSGRTPTPVRSTTPAHTATPVRTTAPASTSTAAAACSANVNGDHRVNLRDLLLVLTHRAPHHYDAKYDVDHDGKVNIRDLLAVRRQLGRRC